MNWKKWLDAIAAADTVEPTLPEISDAEVQLYCEAITRAETTGSAEPRKPEWKRSFGESWDDWLRRSASQQPRREVDDD